MKVLKRNVGNKIVEALAQARKERDVLKQALEHAKTWIEGDQDLLGGEITFNFGERSPCLHQ